LFLRSKIKFLGLCSYQSNLGLWLQWHDFVKINVYLWPYQFSLRIFLPIFWEIYEAGDINIKFFRNFAINKVNSNL